MELARHQSARSPGFSRPADATVVIACFAATLFLSALLLFSVQPMFARMVLPKLGGSPSVWAVSMCFFQGVLLIGYCYAHLLNRWASLWVAPLVHLAVMVLALLALPIGLPESRSEPPAGDAYFWLVGTLALGVGLPFFAVAANAPLLQAWFARSGHPEAHDPYFLYGASNLGSLLALLAYPVVIEPLAGLAQQSVLWSGGFLVLMAMIMFCAVLGLVYAARTSAAPAREAACRRADGVDAKASAPTAAARLSWIALAFVPSGLLVAFTSFVTTDVASAPFLWVVPLAVFLLTFILVFTDRPLVPQRTMLLLQVIATAGVLLGLSMTGSRGWLMATIFGSVAFFAATMVCHRELYERRPQSRHLTEFYLFMSLGGVLGGVFAAIVAPQIFHAIWEFPLLLVLAMACRPGALARNAIIKARDGLTLALAVVAGMVLIASLHRSGWIATGNAELVRVLVILGAGALAMMSAASAPRQLAMMGCAALAIVLLPSAMNRGDSVRSFFGTHRIALSSDGTTRLLLHGTTIHGAERLVDAAGLPVARPVPATYYHPASPMARGVEFARALRAARGHTLRVGIVGLGAGSMACYARPEEAWRFFEIDPVVAAIARDPRRFRFLSVCRPEADIVLGDARLTLAKEPPGSFDYLVIDAFSSDSVPVHLLTVEALRLYLAKLAPEGILALHVSNRHMDLVAVASALGTAIPGLATVVVEDRHPGRGYDATISQVVMIARSEGVLAPVMALPGARPVAGDLPTAWSDDFSNVIGAIWRKYRGS